MAFKVGTVYIPGADSNPVDTYAHGLKKPGTGRDATYLNDGNVNLLGYGFGTYHMAERPDIWEPLRTNNFEFQVEGLGEALYKAENGANINQYPDAYRLYNILSGIGYNAATAEQDVDELIRVSVETGFLPHFSLNPIPVKRGNSTLNYAGTPSWSTGQSIRLKDYIGLNAKTALMAWLNLSYNYKTERVGLASSYKLNCYVTEYSPDYIRVRRWKLYGCWITNITEGGLDSSLGDNLNTVTVSLSYDRAELESED